jgi:hypothetical protein
MSKRDFTSPLAPIEFEAAGTRLSITPITEDQVRICTMPDGMNVRGVMVTCDENFMRDGDHWISYSEKHSRFQPTVRRAGTYDDATPAMRKTVMSVFRQAAEGFAAANRGLMVKAALVAVSNDVHRIDNDIEKAEKVLNDLLDQRRKVLAREREIQALEEGPAPAPRM